MDGIDMTKLQFDQACEVVACNAAERSHKEQCDRTDHSSESCCYHIACLFKSNLDNYQPLLSALWSVVENAQPLSGFHNCDDHCAELMDDKTECVHFKLSKALHIFHVTSTQLTTQSKEEGR